MNHPEREINTVWRSDAKVGPGGFVQKPSCGWFREDLLLVSAESNPAGIAGKRCSRITSDGSEPHLCSAGNQSEEFLLFGPGREVLVAVAGAADG